ncbi:MAG: tRNA pseudouridine(55) synthase TruB [Ignavibacteriaceae bacterium]|nr:MAG: tRNA pseudouridine(55) synthase TruB [Chlorobiota bacterium]MBV6397839.1 tRNA pseudouridine synthase B [Ignavibacteria bacterium]MCC6886907.1 tRNA pseudouridine(55) synthase TruB [Ignavibacteriales bacterium]MCE7953995.1 tRNA pseudouridine(55) synthase TruB [Chlorobi bacterium CHB7]MDL1887895.1 tRNA pseudouridine(55) synthase TruB [Ignavibacteria bacterium CHB1]MEB2330318.1 tRNA pseudouridine(55) synthase TruB [Ignavibacteriaceae bacterium]OQY76796.1 MAG: tRNA pseudouridine(55) syntha
MDLSVSIILADKPVGLTSNDVLNIFKKKFGIKKAGHAGTLDPNASGLLLICTGKMTKLMDRFIDLDKEYIGVIKLGAVTESFDTETPVMKVTENFRITTEDLRVATEKFRGSISQIPPMHSAIKFKGKPLYKFARKGRTIERKPREVFISEFETKLITGDEVHFRISCSKGTYIRTIANDLGAELGVGAYLKELRRTRIGKFTVENFDNIVQEIKFKVVHLDANRNDDEKILP